MVRGVWCCAASATARFAFACCVYLGSLARTEGVCACGLAYRKRARLRLAFEGSPAGKGPPKSPLLGDCETEYRSATLAVGNGLTAQGTLIGPIPPRQFAYSFDASCVPRALLEVSPNSTYPQFLQTYPQISLPASAFSVAFECYDTSMKMALCLLVIALFATTFYHIQQKEWLNQAVPLFWNNMKP